MMRVTWAVFCIAIMFSIVGCFDEGRVPTLASPETALAPAPTYLPAKPFVQVFYVSARDGVEGPVWKKKRRIRREMRRAQAFFATEMERHGHGAKTFEMFRMPNGNIDVADLQLEETSAFYRSEGYEVVTAELSRRFFNHSPLPEDDALFLEELEARHAKWSRTPIHVYFIDIPVIGECARAGGERHRGVAWMFDCWDWDTVAHELGHAFNLEHDFSEDDRLMGFGWAVDERHLSEGAAKWLSFHHVFSTAEFTVPLLTNGLYSTPAWNKRQLEVKLSYRYTDPWHGSWVIEPAGGYRHAVLLKEGWGGYLEVIEFARAVRFAGTDKVVLSTDGSRFSENAVYLLNFPGKPSVLEEEGTYLKLIGVHGIPSQLLLVKATWQ